MNEAAAKHLGNGLAWFGFWLMLGLANFGESPASVGQQVFDSLTKEAADGQQSKSPNNG